MESASPPSTVPALLASLVERRGDHPALVTPHETLSYAELSEQSRQLARSLVAAGAGKGTRMALLAPDGAFWVTAFLAATRIGALLTLVSTLATPVELAHILRNSDCRFLLAARRYLGHDYARTLEQALPGLAESKAGAIMVPAAPYLRAVWLDDADGCGWAAPLGDLSALADVPGSPDASILTDAEAQVTPGEDAIVVYTSGSTARPKAIVHRQWAIARHSPVLAAHFALTSEDRMMPLLPAFWLAGLSTMTQTLSIGATVVYPESPEIIVALDMIERHGVTRVNAWGDRQPKLIAAAKERGIALDHIPELSQFRDAQGEPIGQKIAMYGMTESFSAHSAHPVNQPLPQGKEGSFGRAINDYERRVVDPETGAEVAAGEVGELQIRGPAMLSGFYGQDRRTVFTQDGFYPTRDLVRIDADGWLYPAGRLDDMIKTRGANVSRLEVEAALAALPGVAQAVVSGLPDEEFGKIVVAAVVPADGAKPDPEILRAALRETLSSYKVPRRIVLIEESDIPRTATGKVRLSDTAAMIARRIQDSNPEIM